MRRKKILPITAFAFACTVIPSLALILGLFAYTVIQNDRQGQRLLREYEQNVVRSVERTVEQMDDRMKDIAHSTDFRTFANSSDFLLVNKKSGDLLDATLRDLRAFPEAIASIYYNSQCDSYARVAKNSNYTGLVYEKIQAYCREGSIVSETALFPLESEGQILIVYQIVQRYGNLILVLDPAKNPEYISLCKVLHEGETLAFSTQGPEEGTGSLSHATSTQVDGLYLHYTRARPSLSTLVDSNQRILLPLIVLALLAIPAVFILFLRKLVRPMYQLTKSFQIIGGGDRNYRIRQDNSIQEIHEIYEGFNTMMDNIHTAEERNHRSEMEAVRAKLQYLQLQIRPHFFLNCLKNIYSMADLKKYGEIQDLVLFLSHYLRYSFQDVTAFTSLTNELEAVKSYVNLMKCMSSQVQLEFSLESDVLNAKCLPLTALTFVENCFKYQNGEHALTIQVKVTREWDRGVPYVGVQIANNGGSFDQQVLQEINGADPAQFTYRSEKVGIANVKYRLWHSYSGKATVWLSSEGEWAIVRIRFPYLPMEGPSKPSKEGSV